MYSFNKGCKVINYVFKMNYEIFLVMIFLFNVIKVF